MAVLILVFAVITPLGLLARAIADSNYAKNQVTAYYLAQEGLELVINKRDENLLPEGNQSADWLADLEDCIGNQYCQIDINSSQEVEADECNWTEEVPNNDCRLYIEDEEDGRYTTDIGAAPSLFYRSINIEEREDNSAVVKSLVLWTNKGKPVSVELATVVYNYEVPPPEDGSLPVEEGELL